MRSDFGNQEQNAWRLGRVDLLTLRAGLQLLSLKALETDLVSSASCAHRCPCGTGYRQTRGVGFEDTGPLSKMVA